VISALVTLSAALVIAFAFGWKLAIVLVFGVPIIAGAAYKQLMLVRKSQKRDSECMDEAGRVSKSTVKYIIYYKYINRFNNSCQFLSGSI
jgi:ABC-type multidrug transport system fused ATPase/permease subunit